jgi:hypothetical protein
MADISMCKNDECTLKEECYRYTATPNPYMQSYAFFEQDKEGKCNYFYDNKKNKNLNEHRKREDN